MRQFEWSGKSLTKVPASREAQEAVQRPWWRRIFGG
jgi:hypothetical protein